MKEISYPNAEELEFCFGTGGVCVYGRFTSIMRVLIACMVFQAILLLDEHIASLNAERFIRLIKEGRSITFHCMMFACANLIPDFYCRLFRYVEMGVVSDMELS
ncbi:Ras modification protein [Dirofilaria immitis]